MNQPLPLYPGARTCINSGYCCRQAPCPFGEWDAAKHQCKHLTDENLCARYNEILASPGKLWELAPAFGAGCCSPFNSDRARLLARLRRSANRHPDRSAGQHAEPGRAVPVAEPGG